MEKFNFEKALEVLLYTVHQCPDMYKALKIIYFADREHLQKYGRLICDETYIAMNSGPVPSGIYDMIKYVRGDGIIFIVKSDLANNFRIEKNAIIALRQPDLNKLSESEIECLDQAIAKYKNWSFQRLKNAAHDRSYENADQNDVISFESLVKSLPQGDLVWDYVRNN